VLPAWVPGELAALDAEEPVAGLPDEAELADALGGERLVRGAAEVQAGPAGELAAPAPEEQRVGLGASAEFAESGELEVLAPAAAVALLCLAQEQAGDSAERAWLPDARLPDAELAAALPDA
jgi:hypothetical protein